MSTLQPGSTLQNGKYEIQRVLGQGGFGVTYLALQQGLNRIVAIKEFFMENFCVRNADTHHVTIATEGSRELVERYRNKFLKEARNIAKLEHPNIVSIIDVFEENSTAYYVMKYAQNGSLDDKVKREGHLSEAEATRYILKIANALRFVHQHKMTHLDVKPANILLSDNDEPWLIDFGLSKQYDTETGEQTSSTPLGYSPGFAPIEQYMTGGAGTFSPESDIYSLGATFYKLLTGNTPPQCFHRCQRWPARASVEGEGSQPADHLRHLPSHGAPAQGPPPRHGQLHQPVREGAIGAASNTAALAALHSSDHY